MTSGEILNTILKEDQIKNKEVKTKVYNKHNFSIHSFIPKNEYSGHSMMHITKDYTEVTNGHYLIRVNSIEIDKNDLPTSPDNKKPSEKDINIIISKESAQEIEKNIPKKNPTIPILRNTWITNCSSDYTEFTMTDLEIWKPITTRNLDTRFPNTESIIENVKEKKPKVTIGFNVEYMEKICQQFKKMNLRGVELSIYKEDEAMKLEGIDHDTQQKITAILMPMKI